MVILIRKNFKIEYANENPFRQRPAKALAPIPEGKLVIGFFIDVIYGSQAEWMKELAIRCNARGMQTIALYTPASIGQCSIPTAEIQAVVERTELGLFSRINIFIMRVLI